MVVTPQIQGSLCHLLFLVRCKRAEEEEKRRGKIKRDVLYLEMLTLETRTNSLEDGHTDALEVNLLDNVEQFLDLVDEQHLLRAVADRPHTQQKFEYLTRALVVDINNTTIYPS